MVFGSLVQIGLPWQMTWGRSEYSPGKPLSGAYLIPFTGVYQQGMYMTSCQFVDQGLMKVIRWMKPWRMKRS